VNLNATILAQMIVFSVVVWVTMKWLWPMIAEPIEKRQQRVADGLAAAERGQKDLAAAESRVEELVRGARARALAIEQQAQTRANEIVETAKQTAQTEGARLVESARARVALDAQKARDELRGQVAALAVSGAARILEREIDPRTHAQLLDKLAAGL
jgi:F-type H+-transporting ATPase subunit b